MLEEGAYAAITTAESSRDASLTFIHNPIHVIIDEKASTYLRKLGGIGNSAIVPKQLLATAFKSSRVCSSD